MALIPRRLRTALTPAAPGEAQTATSIAVLMRLVTENARRHTGRYAAAIAFMIVASACTALSAWIMEDVIDEVFVRQRMSAVWVIAGVIAAIFLVKGFATYFHATILARTGNSIIAGIQRRIYDAILSQSLGFFHQRESGDLVTRLVGTSLSARQAIELVFVSLGRDLVTILGLIVVMLSKDLTMTAIALIAAPLVVYLITRIARRVRHHADIEFRSRREIVAAVQETSGGADVIKAFTLEDHMQQRASAAIASVEARNNRIARLQAQSSPIMETLGGLSFAAVILYGGYQVTQQGQNPGALFAFLTALLLAYEPAKKLSRLRVVLEQHLVSVRLMYEVIDTPPEIADPPGAPDLHVTNGQVTFHDVHFRYPSADIPVLRGLGFVAEAGKVTALVGPSGAGKSTALCLIERFFVADSGRVAIDGQDVREIAVRSLRNQVALVTQETFLFDGTIRENLQLGREDATMAELVAAATAAHAHEFIEAQPAGYDTPIGERGVALSGGQRQRLSIARAILRDAPILLLDEPTAALDAESEAHVQAALDNLMQNRTSIVIAHRLSTVRNAHVIHVMDQGHIVQSGTHAELLAMGGLYTKLHELQFDTAPDDSQ